MTKSTARRTRLVIQRDITKALEASKDELMNRTNTYGLGLAYDYQDMANEYTITAASLLLEEELRDL